MEVAMLEQYFLKPQTIDRIRANWLAEPIERYVTLLHDRDYAARNVFRRVPLLLRFGAYAQSRGAKVWSDLPLHVQGFVDDWMRGRIPNWRTERARKSVVNAVRGPIEQMVRLLLPDFAGSERGRLFPFTEQVPGFVSHLRDERGLQPKTLLIYRHCLRRLQDYLTEIKVSSLEELSPTILSAFVTKCSEGWGTSMLSSVCAVLRVFLRYLFREKLVPQELSQCIDGPRKYRLSTIPRSISWTEVERMLATVDRRTVVGKRDYVILLLLVTYGLRGREVAALTLDDIDWERDRLKVPERKAGHSTAYPLSPIVGQAIIDYLKHGRPQKSDRHIFYRVAAPWKPMTDGGVSTRASYYLRKAGVPVPRPGSHTLRHTCVQRLIDAHFPLKTIGDYVGHASPESTAIYAKVSIENLREVALGDGEEVV
jgi:integrase/recombinase XerD